MPLYLLFVFATLLGFITVCACETATLLILQVRSGGSRFSCRPSARVLHLRLAVCAD